MAELSMRFSSQSLRHQVIRPHGVGSWPGEGQDPKNVAFDVRHDPFVAEGARVGEPESAALLLADELAARFEIVVGSNITGTSSCRLPVPRKPLEIRRPFFPTGFASGCPCSAAHYFAGNDSLDWYAYRPWRGHRHLDFKGP